MSPKGLPPRMRGKEHLAHACHGFVGITPAYAGKRCGPHRSVRFRRDHPRVCGEKCSFSLHGSPWSGSPPRVRGKAGCHAHAHDKRGITPAYAGKRDVDTSHADLQQDHPRVCGEKISFFFTGCSPKGSPPRMRGKAGSVVGVVGDAGITPAYAGKSSALRRSPAASGDHPRVCGEKSCSSSSVMPLKGSPPRVRGKADNSSHCQIAHRITPACAGKSCRLRQLHGAYRDHPRVCGEKLFLLGQQQPTDVVDHPFQNMMLHHSIPDTAAHDGRQVLRDLRRHLKCDWDGHLRLVQVGNVVHERALMPDVHESQPRRTPQRHNDRMGQPVQAGMHGGSHGCRGRAAAPKCPAHHPWLLPPCKMVIRPRP